MSPLRTRSPSSRPSRRPVNPIEVHAVVEAFFDALGHFAGEQPALDDLARVLAPDAEILDGIGEDEEALTHYRPEAWLRRIEESAATARSEEHGHFFEEVERTVTDCAPGVRVRCVVEERLTRGASVEHVGTLRCAVVVGRVGDHASIVQVSVRRSSRPPPRCP